MFSNHSGLPVFERDPLYSACWGGGGEAVSHCEMASVRKLMEERTGSVGVVMELVGCAQEALFHGVTMLLTNL